MNQYAFKQTIINHYDEGYGGYCDAKLEFTGRINAKGYGMLCQLLIGIELRKVRV